MFGAMNMSTPNNLQQLIRQRLAESAGDGSFKQIVQLDSGKQVIHRFSLATGMASLHWRGQYQIHFGRPVPNWVNNEHPSHQRGLCKLAIQMKTKLPEDKPV